MMEKIVIIFIQVGIGFGLVLALACMVKYWLKVLGITKKLEREK